MLTIERLIEDELFIQCPLVTSNNFVNFCKERGISISEKDLEFYEKLGIFYPIARVEFPKLKRKIEYIDNGARCRDLGILQEGEEWSGDIEEIFGHFWWGKDIAKEFYQEGLLWSPKDRAFMTWDNFYDKELQDKKIESYYSIFQIYPLYMIEMLLSMNLSLVELATDDQETTDKLITQIRNISTQAVQELTKGDNISDEIAYICQIISNRYFPKTQTDRRTIKVSYPSHYHNWSWRSYCRTWNAKTELLKVRLNEGRIKKYQEIMSLRVRSCDPLENWYDLVQFISLEKKEAFKRKSLVSPNFLLYGNDVKAIL